MRPNRERWIDASLLIQKNADLPKDELVGLVHIETGVPEELLWDALNWSYIWGNVGLEALVEAKVLKYINS